jgi:signal transduction histidine kinase/CheY-like chemotaxis protein
MPEVGGTLDSRAPQGPTPPFFQRLLARSVIYPFVLLGLLALVLILLILHLLAVINSAEQMDLVISKATLIEKLVVDRETGLRGYVITKETSFLEPYTQATGPLNIERKAIRNLLLGNAEQTARLDLVDGDLEKWQQYADEINDLVSKGGDATSAVMTQRGKTLVDEIRGAMQELVRSETSWRADQLQAARSATNLVLATSGGATLLIGIVLAVLVRKQIGLATGIYQRALAVEEMRNKEKAELLAGERAARSAAEHAGRMKDEFLATLSHELRTPLNAIVGWSQLLPRVSDNKEDLRQGLETIERNARIQAQLIDDLLDMSRIVSGKLRLEVQWVDPSAFIRAAIETMTPAARAKSIRIECLLDPQAGPISGDPNRLQQVVWNLLSNAVKFTPKDGKVQVLLQRINSHIEITVSDTGQGIKPNLLPYLFERFRQGDSSTTRAHGGLGLGLAIVKQLVELHGGTIRGQSDGEGKGSTFAVALPLTILRTETDSGQRLHPRTPIAIPFTRGTADLTGLKILVVDDEADARDLVRRVLVECKATVATASSAAEALQMIEREAPDVLISDIGMPEVDGYVFLSKVRSSKGGAAIRAIALTAFARSEDRTKTLMTGYLAHLAKPVEPSELVATIASIAGRTGQQVN